MTAYLAVIYNHLQPGTRYTPTLNHIEQFAVESYFCLYPQVSIYVP